MSNKTVLVGGPYLVRNATISGSTLAIRGDLNGSTTLTVIAPPEFSRVTWNGIPVLVDVRASRSLTSVVGFVWQLKMLVSSGSVDVPKLQNWKFEQPSGSAVELLGRSVDNCEPHSDEHSLPYALR